MREPVKLPQYHKCHQCRAKMKASEAVIGRVCLADCRSARPNDKRDTYGCASANGPHTSRETHARRAEIVAFGAVQSRTCTPHSCLVPGQQRQNNSQTSAPPTTASALAGTYRVAINIREVKCGNVLQFDLAETTWPVVTDLCGQVQ